MRATHLIPETFMRVLNELLKDPMIERVGFCDLRRKSWTWQGAQWVDDVPGSLWQALSDCYTVLNLQRLPCRHLHWVLDSNSVAGVHHAKVGTLGLVTKRHLPTELLAGHMERMEAALREAAG